MVDCLFNGLKPASNFSNLSIDSIDSLFQMNLAKHLAQKGQSKINMFFFELGYRLLPYTNDLLAVSL